MTIKVYKDRIEFDDYVLRATPTGFSFNGEIQGKNFFRPFQGTVAGFTAGGYSAPTTTSNIIDKFSFTTDANATDGGDLTQSRGFVTGQSSTTHGYTSGGQTPGSAAVNTIDKFLFSINSNATDVGDLAQANRAATGQSSATQGYFSGGDDGVPSTTNVVQRFPFAVDLNSVSSTTLTVARTWAAGQSSNTSGYTSGGFISPAATNTIDKFPFASDASSTDVGDLFQARWEVAGQSSTTHGYTSGGNSSGGALPADTNTIDKFPFASDANATDVGDLSSSFRVGAGQSSTTNGYTSGGFISPPTSTYQSLINKFPFATDTSATNIASLFQARGRTNSGTQY